MSKTDPFHLLLEGIADYGIFLLDTDGRVSRWSPSAQKLFGYGAEDIEGKDFSVLYGLTQNDPDLTREELEMAAAHGRFEDVGWRIRKDQSRFWADCVICPIRDDGGQPKGFSVVVRDISERKKAEEALLQKEEELSQARKMEAVGRLAGGIAHDFNNFITGIMGLSEELRQSMNEQDPRRADLDEILKTADQARALTRELLAFGRRQASAPQVLNLNNVLTEKKRIFMRLLGADIQLKTQLDLTIRHILIDPTQLDQILINLLMNARDAMPQGGTIRIETRRAAGDDELSGPQVVLTISDNGCGMEESVVRRVFEPFFTTKDQGKGTGLGLATVYGIVKQNHGHISVDSHPGEGTTFTISFPEIDAPVKVQPAPLLAPTPAGSETILVVEDTDVVRRVVKQALETGGYRVLVAHSGSEALKLAKAISDPINLILTDVIMPGMNGCELAQIFSEIRPETAIVYMSAYAEDLVLERGYKSEGAAFLEKPFTSASLLHKIREVLDARRLFNVTHQ